jgi:DNA-binding transcriptional LysR family regulator
MVEGIEALIALERTGTISQAAAQLRLTQSAVSKRIQALENDLKINLIEPDGRRVRLTQKGILFLSKARLILVELKSLKDLNSENEIKKYSIALSDSVAASWGPKLIKLATQSLENVELEIHVHRSTLVEENVKLGRYHLGLCISPIHDPQIVSQTIVEEPMVLISSPSAGDKNTDQLLTIEKNSGSWKAIEDKVLKHPKIKNLKIQHSESFAAIIQMVNEGFGNGLVPLGIAQAMNFNKKNTLVLSPNIKRPIKLIGRKNLMQQKHIIELKDLMAKIAKELK